MITYEQLHLFTLMKRRCGVKQGLRNRWFHLQNEINTRWGDSKNEIGFDVHHIYEQNEIKTRPIMVEKCQNLRNEIKTRCGDSVNLLYWGHRINKTRRSYIIYICCIYRDCFEIKGKKLADLVRCSGNIGRFCRL